MVICIKQHLINIWSSIHEKAIDHWGWAEKIALLTKNGIVLNYIFSYFRLFTHDIIT